MKTTTLRRLAALLCVLLMLPLNSVLAQAAPAQAEEPPVANTTVEAIPQGMTVGLENNSYRVYIDTTTGRFGLMDKASGQVWWSNPASAETDPLANGKVMMEMQSNLLIRFAANDADELESLNSYAAAVQDGNVIVKLEQNRITIGYKIMEYRFYVPLTLTLDDNGLVCEVKPEEIREDGDYRIYELSLLPYFGAGEGKDEGYLFVPDGSGAIIRFKNGKHNMTQYRENTYGYNYTSDLLTDSASTQAVRMPVYGIHKNGHSLLAVLEDGSGIARIQANVGGRTSECSHVYPTFNARVADTYYTGQSLGNARKVLLLDEDGIEIDRLALRLSPVKKEDGTGYVGMAKTYRRYLINNGMKKPEAYEQEVHLQLLGSVRKTEHFLGIPYQANVTVTSLKETEELLNAFKADGISNVAVRYLNWNKHTISGKATDKVGVIGGKKALNSLMETAREMGVAVYPDNDFTVVNKLSWTYSKRGSTARTLGQKPVMVYNYSFIHYFKDNLTMPRYLLSAKASEKLYTKFLSRFNKLNVGYVGVGESAEVLCADFGEEIWTREHSLDAMSSIAAKAAEKNGVLVSGGNAYALPYAQRVMNAPISHSAYDVEDDGVPFYQIALYGYIPTSGTAINMAENDAEYYLLKALETGSSVCYFWTAAESRELNDSVYENKYSTQYDVWYEQAVKYAGVLKEFSAKVTGSDIATHDKLAEGVFRTTWDNGVSVTVNYNRAAVTVDGQKLEAGSYRIKEGSK